MTVPPTGPFQLPGSSSRPIVKVLADEHGGQTVALDRALRQAQRDYVEYLDADDLLAPDKVAIQMLRLMSHPTMPSQHLTANILRGRTRFPRKPDATGAVGIHFVS
jgi:glycosyltransferase involved in cell wall biosynthesis